MEDMQINLENFGGDNVEFPLSRIEQKHRVREAIKLRATDSAKFEKDLIAQFEILENFCFERLQHHHIDLES